MPSVEVVNKVLGLLVIGTQVTTGLLLLSLLFKKEAKELLSFFSKNAFRFSFIVSATSMLGSLFYSEVAGYGPCPLCWYQRIFMYPLAFIFGRALWKKKDEVLDYALLLSVTGGLIALYHYLNQIGVVASLPCSAVGYSASCSQRFVMQYGYITLPLMSLTGFALISTMMLVRKLVGKKK